MIIREFLVSWSKMTPYSQKLRNIAMLKNSLIQCLKWIKTSLDVNYMFESCTYGVRRLLANSCIKQIMESVLFHNFSK